MNIDEKRKRLAELCDKNSWCGGCEHCVFANVATPNDECDFTEMEDAYIGYMYDMAFPPDPAALPITDAVNHPSHYNTSKFECIDVMVDALGVDIVKGFSLGNAFKYIYRCMNKHESPVEDVKKAKWYLEKFIELEKEND